MQAVCDDPVSVLHDTSSAANELVAAGGAALPSIAQVIRDGWTSSASGIDIVEAISYVLARIARSDREAVTALLSDETLKPNKFIIEWALTSDASKKRS